MEVRGLGKVRLNRGSQTGCLGRYQSLHKALWVEFGSMSRDKVLDVCLYDPSWGKSEIHQKQSSLQRLRSVVLDGFVSCSI